MPRFRNRRPSYSPGNPKAVQFRAMTDTDQPTGRHAAKQDDLGARSTVNIKKYLEKDEALERQAATGRHAAPEEKPEN